jgi:hypothetical protein
MHLRVVPDANHNERADGHYVRAEATCRPPQLGGGRSLVGRKRSHKIDSEESVFCGGELTAYAERVYARENGRQGFSFLVGSMDWRR